MSATTPTPRRCSHGVPPPLSPLSCMRSTHTQDTISSSSSSSLHMCAYVAHVSCMFKCVRMHMYVRVFIHVCVCVCDSQSSHFSQAVSVKPRVCQCGLLHDQACPVCALSLPSKHKLQVCTMPTWQPLACVTSALTIGPSPQLSSHRFNTTLSTS